MRVKIKKIKLIYTKDKLDCKMVDLFDDITDKTRQDTLRDYINDLEEYTGCYYDINDMNDNEFNDYVEFLEYLADK